MEPVENPPFGSEGVRLELECGELLEGFSRGRTVRLGVPGFGVWQPPREETLYSRDVRAFRVAPVEPSRRGAGVAFDE